MALVSAPQQRAFGTSRRRIGGDRLPHAAPFLGCPRSDRAPAALAPAPVRHAAAREKSGRGSRWRARAAPGRGAGARRPRGRPARAASQGSRGPDDRRRPVDRSSPKRWIERMSWCRSSVSLRASASVTSCRAIVVECRLGWLPATLFRGWQQTPGAGWDRPHQRRRVRPALQRGGTRFQSSSPGSSDPVFAHRASRLLAIAVRS